MGVVTAIIGSVVVGGLMSSKAQKKAASKASAAQTQAADKGIAEQRRQFDAMQQLMAPFVRGGTDAFSQMMAISGAAGPEAQQELIAQLEAGPEFQSLVRSGEEAILQSASATGGLRGGNVQEALAKFRPEVLSSLIRDKYSQFGNIAQMGQSAAAGQAAQGMNMASNIGNLYGQQGAAQAGAALARGQATASMWGNIAGSVGLAGGLGYLDGLGGMFKGNKDDASVGPESADDFSDIRLKEGIEPIGTRAGHNWYRFRYVWDDPGTVREGVMAQEVMQTRPDAVVTHPTGFYMVNYEALGV